MPKIKKWKHSKDQSANTCTCTHSVKTKVHKFVTKILSEIRRPKGQPKINGYDKSEGKVMVSYNSPWFVLLQKPRYDREENSLGSNLFHTYRPYLFNCIVQPPHCFRIRKYLKNWQGHSAEYWDIALPC